MSENPIPGYLPAEEGRRRRGAYAIPSLFTTANIFCGFYAVIAALKGYQALGTDLGEATRLFDNAAKAIGFAVLFDALDGRIARMTKTTSDFGVELDSLADVLSFGLAPALLAYAWGYGVTPDIYGLEMGKAAWVISFLYLVCGAFRLARFNVHARRTVTAKDRRQFVGLPIPAAAGLIAAIVHFSPTPLLAQSARSFEVWGNHVLVDSAVLGFLMLLLVAALSGLMISTIRYRSFKDLGVGALSPRWTLLLLSLLVAGIYFYSQWVLIFLASAYVVHGLAMKGLALLRLGRKEPASAEVSTPIKSEP
ncbi:MAG: CDP-diacylglycerol--serine O-phosphatidyltransferase [Blastocatellia bacterium]|nr:CDP-diacylglycerol--serine O-phosphatidyltransferase [Blastocatellia bacterium]MCS7157157.1 CDP-diacylglycerol--serine O-phosphatidyltransferase [Blastocatellia bacterium]MCX7752380.1 CDP-diacylglycerol--serine O-phosphatidyltransferase [Blastocatellia bacterium]MDW8167263.1 CDP-diacylglycerol--serine O-phosphatidyltransferase [Acidobacteriota bacterium]